MIFLELHNRAVEEILIHRFENAKNGCKHEKFDYVLVDFDGTIYRLRSIPNDRSKISVSIKLYCYHELIQHGLNEILKREYGKYVAANAEEDYSVSLFYNLESLPEDHRSLAQEASLLKRNCFSTVLEKFFTLQALVEEGLDNQKTVIHFSYVNTLADRVTVIFSTVFNEIDDLVIAKVFLQEFVEVRRRFDRAPQVLYSQSTPPSELLGTNAIIGDNVAYITFVLFPRHFTPATINLIFQLRNYLHYHIKCSKGYIHRRMRAKIMEFVKILNRARPMFSETPTIQIESTNRRPFNSSITTNSDLSLDYESVLPTTDVKGHGNGEVKYTNGLMSNGVV